MKKDELDSRSNIRKMYAQAMHDQKEQLNVFPVCQNIVKPVNSGSLHYVCNADCPDVEYGNCCHPKHCQKTLVSNDR